MNELITSNAQHVPIETRVFYGVTYSAGVATGGFKISIADPKDPLDCFVECPDISSENPKELLERAHTHAHKLILDKQNLHNHK